jgi:hypothetical protein
MMMAASCVWLMTDEACAKSTTNVPCRCYLDGNTAITTSQHTLPGLHAAAMPCLKLAMPT